MFHRLALAIIPLALLAAACSGGDGTDDGVQRDVSQPTAAPTAAPTAEPPAAVGDTGDGSNGSAGEALFGALNPFDLVGGFDAAGGLAELGQDVDPSLSAALIRAGDLPSDYSALGDFTFSVPTEYGPMEMAASQFGTGDPTGADMGSMVMSAAVALPPEAMDELGDLSELEDLTEEDLAEMEDLEGMGMGLEGFQLLDTSGLGDGGAAFHMEIDLGAFFDALIAGFGEEFGDIETDLSEEEMQMPDGIGMDIYMFVRGERMLMLMVMWPLGEDPGVDARELADTMDDRAAAAF